MGFDGRAKSRIGSGKARFDFGALGRPHLSVAEDALIDAGECVEVLHDLINGTAKHALTAHRQNPNVDRLDGR